MKFRFTTFIRNLQLELRNEKISTYSTSQILFCVILLIESQGDRIAIKQMQTDLRNST